MIYVAGFLVGVVIGAAAYWMATRAAKQTMAMRFLEALDVILAPLPDGPVECDCDYPMPSRIGECQLCHRRVIPEQKENQ